MLPDSRRGRVLVSSHEINSHEINSHKINSHVLLFRNGQISYWLLNETEMNFGIHQRIKNTNTV